MPEPGLTRRQRQLIREIDEALALAGFDYANLIERFPPAYLTTALERTREQIAIAAIVGEYTFLDELLGTAIVRYFFGVQGAPGHETFGERSDSRASTTSSSSECLSCWAPELTPSKFSSPLVPSPVLSSTFPTGA